MTIGKETWQHIKATKAKYILPRPDGTTDSDTLNKINVKLVVFDHLGALRTTPALFEVNERTGEYGRITCANYLDKVFDLPFAILRYTEVEKVVICLDAYGRRRPEKAATTAQRKRKRPDDCPNVVIPQGQAEFFEDDKPMPCDLDYIFEDANLKAEFYVYITNVFKRFSDVAEGKLLILSRGLEWRQDHATGRRVPVVIPPIEVSHKGVRYMDEVVNDNVSEGDLDVLYFAVNVFPKDNVHIYSYDADVLLVGLLQMRRIYAATPDRICVFVTRRSVGSVIPDDTVVKYREAAKRRRTQVFAERLVSTARYEEAFHASGGYLFDSLESPKVTPRKQTIWQEYHIDIKGMYLDILNNEHTANPVEVYVVMLMLSSAKHDYIQTNLLTPRIGKDFVWRAFTQDEQHFKDLVTVYSHDTSVELYYEIDLTVFSRFVEAIYRCKGRVPNTDGRVIAKIAAQTVWTLQYLSNGVIVNYDVINGTSKTSKNESVYGFTEKGWAETVYNNGQGKISCPPIIR